jgi:hypothetical protein
MNNIILPPLYHIVAYKRFDTWKHYVEIIPGCFKTIFVHEFQRMDYTPDQFDGFCYYITGLNFSAN